MFKSYRVGTVYGIPLRLDITFLLVLPVFVWIIGSQVAEIAPLINRTFGADVAVDELTGGGREWVIGTVAAVGLFACVMLHELGHAAVALRYGYEVESITLWLLGGVAKPAELPRDWGHEFLIAVAGPTVNVVIVAVCALLLVVVPPLDVAVFLLLYLAMLNITLIVFNMLPAFPLDGGRVLRALLARSRSYVKATRQAATVGKGMAVVLGLFGVLTLNFILAAIALFIYIAAASETRQMMLDAAFDGVDVDAVMTPAAELQTVRSTLELSDLLDVMLEQRHQGYPVVDDSTFVGIVTLSDVQSAGPEDQVVADVLTPAEELETVRPGDGVMDAFESLGKNDIGRLPVVDDDGSLQGLLTRTDLMRAFRIATEQRRFEEEFSEPLEV
ncbi:MAG: site-2 protease family protein [Halovenus sp.]